MRSTRREHTRLPAVRHAHTSSLPWPSAPRRAAEGRGRTSFPGVRRGRPRLGDNRVRREWRGRRKVAATQEWRRGGTEDELVSPAWGVAVVTTSPSCCDQPRPQAAAHAAGHHFDLLPPTSPTIFRNEKALIFYLFLQHIKSICEDDPNIDGFVLLKVAGSIKTVHERGISLSGTWRMLEEAFNAGAEISVQLIFLGTLEELLFASMGQNMASSDGTTSTTARWSSSASFLSSPDDFSVRSLMRTSNPEKFFRFGDAEDLRLLEKQCNAGRSEG